MNTETKNMHALWVNKIESIREQLEQLTNEMSQFKEHPEMRHYSVIMITRQAKFHDGEVVGEVGQITAMASQYDIKKSVQVLIDALANHLKSMEDLSND